MIQQGHDMVNETQTAFFRKRKKNQCSFLKMKKNIFTASLGGKTSKDNERLVLSRKGRKNAMWNKTNEN